MSRALYFMESRKPGHMRLVIRQHDLSGTDYETIAVWPDEIAQEFIRLAEQYAGKIFFVYGEPDWDKRAVEQELHALDGRREALAAKLKALEDKTNG